jgi:hypothetical protein
MLSLDARLAISMRVLRFEASGSCRRTPVRLVSSTGQTNTHWSDWSDWPDAAAPPSSVLALWINQGTQWFSGEPLEPRRTWCSLRQSSLMTRLPRRSGSTLALRLNQETVHDFVLLFMPPCGPHMVSFIHMVDRAEPTCLSTPQRTHRHRPFMPALHLHIRKSCRNLHLQYSAKSQSAPHCPSLITPRSNHPLVKCGPHGGKKSKTKSLIRAGVG